MLRDCCGDLKRTHRVVEAVPWKEKPKAARLPNIASAVSPDVP
jgi:hypothetical protein